MDKHHRRILTLQKQLDPLPRVSDDFQNSACLATVSGSPVFIGGLIMDVQATPDPDQTLVQGGSVPGKVRQIPGGVSHNVAESLYKLLKAHGQAIADLPVLVSVVGKDSSGDALISHWKSFGMTVEFIYRSNTASTPSVSIIFDAQGDVAASIADVAAVENELTAFYIQKCKSKIQDAPFIMIDGDLSTTAIEAACKLAAEHQTPVWFEPVSGPKATRVRSVLHLLDFISPNKQELISMAAAYRQMQNMRTSKPLIRAYGTKKETTSPHPSNSTSSSAGSSGSGIREVLGLHHDIAILLEAGVKNIVLTLGEQGAALCLLGASKRHIEVFYLPPLPTKIENCSGAGDCLVAGFLFGLIKKLEAPELLAHGIVAAKCALETSRNVPESFNQAAFSNGAEQALDNVQYFRMPFFPLL